MDDRREFTGLIGVGFLFGFIGLFLLVVGLRSTGHDQLAAISELTGSATLALAAGRFLRCKWRITSDVAFNADGDVQFCGAVFLLSSLALAAGLIRVAGVDVSRAALLLPLLLSAAAIPARKFAKS